MNAVDTHWLKGPLATPHRLGVIALLLALIAAVFAVVPAAALADGDPGSDVLLEQNLFLSTGANLSAAQQIELGNLLQATAKAGAPIRVAVIASKTGLGTVTQLWHQPQSYSNYLGKELEYTYNGRLLVIMPNGFGVQWFAREKNAAGPDEMATALQHVSVSGVSGKAAFTTVTSAVEHIENAAGISTATLLKYARAANPTGSVAVATDNGSPPQTILPAAAHPSGGGHKLPTGVFGVIVILLGLLYISWRTGRLKPFIQNLRREKPYVTANAGDDGRGRGGLFGLGISPFALIPTGFLVLVVIVLVVSSSGGSSGAAGSQSTLSADNPNLDAGSALNGDKTAPDITLTDQTGQKISLSQYRGKVVILSFIDSECQTICPLTTQAMLDAKRSLGPAAKNVVLLGVNANWKSTSIEDIQNYTLEHGMSGQWNFLTGTPAQLGRIWSAYGVNEFKNEDEQHSNEINHAAATFLISPQGKLERVFETEYSYASIPQFGQELARDASALLPGHPKVSTDYSYATIKGINPYDTVTLPQAGGGTITLQPGKPHLYVFFDTWDEVSGLTNHLEQLKQYETTAAKEGLPQLTAVDEGSVEPNTSALPDYLKTLPSKLNYPIAIDNTGRVADGYNVEGSPWYVLVSATGQIVWDQEVYTQGWPGTKTIKQQIKGDLKKVPTGIPDSAEVQRELSGSPAPLAALHSQSNKVLGGGVQALKKRITSLHGFPVVVNIWASSCAPCQAEFKLFQKASAQFGPDVAFIGADTDTAATLGESFLRQHPVSFPSYLTSDTALEALLVGGLQGTPTTLIYDSSGHRTYMLTGVFDSQSQLNTAIDHYALGPDGCTACK